MIEDNEEVIIEIEDKNEVGDFIMMTTISKRDEIQQEVVGKTTQYQCMTSKMSNVTTVRNFLTMLLNVKHLKTVEFKRRKLLKEQVKKVTPCLLFV